MLLVLNLFKKYLKTDEVLKSIVSLEAEEDKLGIDIAQTNTQKDKLDIDIAQTNTQTHGSLPNASFALEADESLKENSTEDNVVAKGSLRNDSLKDMPTITSLDTEYLTEQFACKFI